MVTKKTKNKWLKYLLIAIAVFALLLFAKFGMGNNEGGESGTESSATSQTESKEESKKTLQESSAYSSKDDVALYIYTFGHLPSNYITKNAAEALGWPGGDLWKYADGKSIGGDKFGNREGLLPKKSGRQYYECDVDYYGGQRDERRLVYSNDGLVYFSDDHYESFILLYGEP